MLSFELQSAEEIAREMAQRLRALRLHRRWTQVEAAGRAGITLASYKRFERTGEVAFRSLLKVAIAFSHVDRLDPLFQPPAWQTLDEAVATPPCRKRAPRRKVT